MSDANELERIYLLKSQGVSDVLADINAITQAFEASAKAKASLGNISNSDNGDLKTVNSLLKEMLDVQNQLLTSLKNLNIEYSKDSSGKFAKNTESAASATMDMSNAAKSLGTNLTGATNGLIKVQTILKDSNIASYDDAIHLLASQFISLQEESGRLKSSMSQLNQDMKQGDMTSFEYEQRLENLKVKLSQNATAISEVSSAMTTLNKTYNTALIDPLVTSTLSAKEEEETIEKMLAQHELYQIKLEDIDNEIERKSNVNQLKKTVEEQEMLDKMLAQHELYQAKVDELAFGIRQKGNVNELEKLAKQESLLSSSVADKKAKQQSARQEVEMLKNKSIILNESASYYQKLAAQVNTLKMSMRLLSEEEYKDVRIKGVMLERLQQLDAEIKSFDSAMGNNQRNVGNYGLAIAGIGNVVQNFARQLVRGIGSILIWQLLFEAIAKVSDEIISSIPGTEAYEKAQEKIIEGNQKLIQSFKQLADELVKNGENLNTFYESLYDGLDEARRTEVLIKAVGVQNGESYDAQNEQSKAHQEVLDKEFEALSRKEKVLKDINKVLLEGQRQAEEYIGSPTVIALSSKQDPQANKNVQYDIFSKLSSAVEKSGLSLENQKKIILDLNKAYEDGSDLIDVYKKSVLELGVDLKKTQEEILTNRGERSNVDIANESKKNEIIYNKNIELKGQLIDLWESYRDLTQKEDIDSVDKIIKNSEAKYLITIGKLKQSTVQYAKTIMDVPLQYTQGGQEDFNSEYNSLPPSVKNNIDKIISVNELTKNRIIKQSIENFYKTSSLSNLQYDSQEQQQQSSISSFNSKYGSANYDNLTKALDDETKAKKSAIELQFVNEKNAYIKLGKDITNIENERKDKLLQIDKEDYQKRLQLGITHFKGLVQSMNEVSAIALTQIDTNTLDKITKVLLGKGFQGDKEKKIEKITKRGVINSANEIIADARGQLEIESGINDQVVNSKKELALAKEDGDVNKIAEANKQLNEVLKKQADLEHQIAKARNDKAKASQKDQQLNRQLLNGLIAIAETAANAYMELLAKQDAYRMEMQKRSLDWNEKQQSAQVQSQNQMLIQQKAHNIAQHQLDKEKAKQDKQRAEQQILINYAIASSKVFANMVAGPAGLTTALIEEGVLLAQLAITEAMLSRAPAYAEGTGNTSHTGGFAWVGDGGEHELIKVGNSVTVSPNKATLVNLPSGADVTPLSKVPGNLGSGLQAPRFNASNTSGGGGGGIDHEGAITHLYGLLGHALQGMANQHVSLDTMKLSKKMKSDFHKNVSH